MTRWLRQLVSHRLFPVGIVMFPVALAFITVPCTRLGSVLLLLLIAALGGAIFFSVRGGSASRAHHAVWLAIAIIFASYWTAKTWFTAVPLDEPIDLQHEGRQVVFHPWRFWPNTTYLLRMHLRAPYGSQMIWTAGDPHAEVWFNEPPTVAITVAAHSGPVIALFGQLSKELLCGGYRECTTSRDELLFDCDRGKFFRSNAFERHAVTLRTVRGSRFAGEFAPRLQIVAVRDWEPLFCATSATLLLTLFAVSSAVDRRFRGEMRRRSRQ